MKKLFYVGLIVLAIFEFVKVYWIMPLSGSQQMETVNLAYFLHTYRWYFRVTITLMILVGTFHAFKARRKWIPSLAVIPVLLLIYFFNFRMSADKMFLPPKALKFFGRAENTLSDSTLVLAIDYEGEAKAYPVRFIVYHHQVRDTLGDKQVMVTYCSVCRTGRVFEPLINGKTENFRLVGMDRFNAMFEDATTKSWWQQSTGEAITGPLKGQTLPEFPSQQLSVNKFFTLYPFGKIMQAEKESRTFYDSLGKFESGTSKGKLTQTDSLSWKEKSWVIGLSIENHTKAYDWRDVTTQRIIHDKLNGIPVLLALSDDGQSFTAFQRTSNDQFFQINNDTLYTTEGIYDFSGRSLRGTGQLLKVKAYQEFWHSWRTFHPNTERYSVPQ
ncbi:MAG: DUF3179 domain-containing (seleno)protein [Cyclobacteriaceae bacterium]